MWSMRFEFSVFLKCIMRRVLPNTQLAFNCSKLTIETLEKGVKYVQG